MYFARGVDKFYWEDRGGLCKGIAQKKKILVVVEDLWTFFYKSNCQQLADLFHNL